MDRLFARAERATALLDRCRPIGGASESRALVADWREGRPRGPRWTYRELPRLGDLRAALDVVSERLDRAGPWGVLYAERARELSTEAALAESVGGAGFRAHAASRYAEGSGPGAEEALAQARAWATACPERDEPRYLSDDPAEPRSLMAMMRRLVGQHRLPIRVVASAELAAAAATGEGVVYVRSGLLHRERDAWRIALHEIYGHALPRYRAAREALGLYAVGSARGADDEEGRALLLEKREGLLGARRRSELGRRHLAALSVRAGATFVETVRMTLSSGAELADALSLAERVHRGGGLARELVYLPALLRVERAFDADPELEVCLERGRISVAAARVLRDLGEPPEVVTSPRAA